MTESGGAAERRRPSLVRLLIVLALAGVAMVSGAGYAFAYVSEVVSDWGIEATSTWSAPYVDVTLTPIMHFEDQAARPSYDVVLAFVVADPHEPCLPSWGTYYSLDAAARALDLDRRIVRLRERGGDAFVSFGGAINNELATVCEEIDELVAAYQAVITRYDLNLIDFDIEGTSLADRAANSRRAEAIHRLQRDNEDLAVWLTLPVAPHGLSADAVTLIDEILGAEGELAGVNLMTMNYGESRGPGLNMNDATVAALTTTSLQLDNAYRRAGRPKTEREIWQLIGATPMIGQNDVVGDVFTPDDAHALFEYAQSVELGRLSFWSINRDVSCGSGIDGERVSNTCSGVDQKPLEFTRIFASGSTRSTPARRGAEGRSDASAISESISRSESFIRDEFNRIFASGSTEGTSVSGGTDGPSEGSSLSETMARTEAFIRDEFNRIFGHGSTGGTPVGGAADGTLDGPATADSLSRGGAFTRDDPRTSPYPLWRPAKVYEGSAKVVWQGRVYQAKWWTQDDQPDAPVKNVWETPWRYLGPVLESDQVAVVGAPVIGENRPQWAAEKVFVAGDEVERDNQVFRAKWWTQGAPPREDPEQAYDHPWVYLGNSDCSDNTCYAGDIAATLSVDYEGLTGISIEIREKDVLAGTAGRLVQTHHYQSGQKTYAVLQGTYDLVFRMGASEFIVAAADCNGGTCDAGDIAATLSVDYEELTDIRTEIRHDDGAPGTAGTIIGTHGYQSGQKSYPILHGTYDLVFGTGAAEFIVDAVDCSGATCQAGDIAATLSVDYEDLTGIHIEIRRDDGTSGTTGALVGAHNNQSGRKSYSVLHGTYDLVFGTGETEFIVDAVDCSGNTADAGDIARVIAHNTAVPDPTPSGLGIGSLGAEGTAATDTLAEVLSKLKQEAVPSR